MIDTLYRVETNYLSKDYSDVALCTSTPCKDLETAIAEYDKSTKYFCSDKKTKHARCRIDKYVWEENTLIEKKTLIKNY